MAANGQLVFTDVDKVTFKGVGNTSNAVIDTTTGKIGVGVDSPDANLHVLGNCFVSTNLELGGTMTMGTVTVNARHELSAITATGNTTPHTVEFQNATTGLVTTGNVGIGTTSPDATLHVVGNAYVSTELTVGGELSLARLVDVGTNSRTRIGLGSGGGTTINETNQIAIGEEAGYHDQGQDAIAIGRQSGWSSQSSNTVAIGTFAGAVNQSSNAVAVGYQSGNVNQSLDAVAIGYQAGASSQGDRAVAIGNGAGQSGSQGQEAVAIGNESGNLSQSSKAVAVGTYAGKTEQGNSAIAVGYSAGETDQGDNSIILNATGVALDSTTASSFHVKPVRGGNFAASALAYTSTGEIVEETNMHFDTAGNVGIGTTSPDYTLDVNGTLGQNGKEIYAQRRWEIDLTAQSNTTFYPIEFTHPGLEETPDLPDMHPIHFKIFGESLGGNDPYNENTLVGYAKGGGWSDHGPMYDVHVERHHADETRFQGLYEGNQGYMNGIVIYVRGGYRYSALTDATEVVTHTSAYTNGSTTFALKNSSGTDVSGTSALITQLVNIAGANGEQRWMSGKLSVSGNVGIGTDTPLGRLHVQTETRSGTEGSGNGIYVTSDCSEYSNGSEFRHSNQTQGTGIGYAGIYATGSNANQDLHIVSRGTGTTEIKNYQVFSDDRVKMNEEYITNATETLLKLKPQIYDKHEEIGVLSDNPLREAGLIAQDIYYDTPELRYLVSTRNKGIDAEPVNIPQEKPFVDDDPANDPDYSGWGTAPASVAYIQLVPYLIKSNQEIYTELQAEKARNDSLELRILALENA